MGLKIMRREEMFREMRLKEDNQLPQEQALEMLEKAQYGVMALDGDDDYPYTVPVNFVFDDNKIYFHGATEGHKVDAIKRSDKASFCVVGQDQVVPAVYTTYYRSVTVFGKCGFWRPMKKRELPLKSWP